MGGAEFVWRISQGLKFPECTLVVVVTTSPCPSNFLYVGSSTGSTICFTFFFFFFFARFLQRRCWVLPLETRAPGLCLL